MGPGSWLRGFVRGWLRLALRAYYRSLTVRGQEHLPTTGPVLLAANHPNSILDPAVLLHLLPRQLRFGAKHTLFAGPFRRILEAFGAIRLVRASDDPRAMRKNLEAFDRYVEVLRAGDVTAIFPEGISQDEAQVAPIKSGAARIALQAEAASGFRLGLTLLPVGLQFEPRRAFRADGIVRIGPPVPVADLAQMHGKNPREAIRVLTERLEKALRALALHVDDPSQTPLVDRLTEVYLARARTTGIHGARGMALQADLRHQVALCVNHYAAADPAALAHASRALTRYERLRQTAGIDRRLLEERSRLLPPPLDVPQAVAEAGLGLLPAIAGLLTGGPPYVATRWLARRWTARRGYEVASSLAHVAIGALLFPAAYALEIAAVAHRYSDAATWVFCATLLPAGLFARLYLRRMRKVALHLGGRAVAWFRLEALDRVRHAQDELLHLLDSMRTRYRAEVLGLPPVPAPPRRWPRFAAAAAGVALLGGTLLMRNLSDRPIEGLPDSPSPWLAWKREDPAGARARLLGDARGAAAAIAALDSLEARMFSLRDSFARGEHSYYRQEGADEIHRLLMTYQNLRTALLRTVWRYRGAAPRDGSPPPDGADREAFLAAFASAASLLEKASVLVDTFGEDAEARRKLDDGDAAWGIPPGAYERALSSLSNASALAELDAAAALFRALDRPGALPAGEPWETLAAAAREALPAVDAAAARVGERKMSLALTASREQATGSFLAAQTLVSTWVGDFRIKDRPPERGLVAPDQVRALRARLRPGDIFLERRNWFMSNAFLPGYWPHSALYLGTPEELEALGVAADPRVAPHFDDFRSRDSHGHAHAVLEAISEGVVFTSLEHSVGEADAVAVLRPRLDDAARREAICRAFSHRGKPYDFEFDFFTSGSLVCTEVVYRSYDGFFELPLSRIMGRWTLPAMSFVEVHAATRGNPDRPFDLVAFLDARESEGRAVEATEEEFLETLRRSNFSFLE